MKYCSLDGALIEAGNAAGIVALMSPGVHQDSVSADAYMQEVAGRVHEWNGAMVRSDCCEDFISDLVVAGVLTPVD